ncbi:beta-N-acetylhexosaminidase [Fulvimonas yonginensis]|uniref:beta-N-acetylhexosaminidase n=1 Tax=Fulvimonas yonginensis TaxID=1495200 RepID=A0ABU8JC80_9GAMM
MQRLLSCLTLAFAALAARAASPEPALIPRPAQLALGAGHFTLAAATRVLVAPGDAGAHRAGTFLLEQLARIDGPHLALREGAPADGAIVLRHDARAGAVAGSYTLDVDAHGIRVVAQDDAGLLHGAATLVQLLDEARDGAVPALHIADAPRFAWRGLMLDSVRHMQSPAQIRGLIDQMALHKLNVLHWHLTDDQGWRIEIERYPELTRIGAWRTPPAAGEDGEPARYGGFYSQQTIRALVAYAAARGITIVPEIDLPGHATAAVAAYPQFGVTGKRIPVSPDWGVHTTLFNVNDPTIAFLEHVLDEVMALFPSRTIHLGGDEAVKDQWQASPAVQARMKALGLASEDQLQGWLMGRLGAYLEAHGRRMIGWDEILAAGVPAEAAVMSWRGTQGAVDAARQGHDVVLSPSPDLYFDQLQSDHPEEPTGRIPVKGLADIYAFEPVPAGLDATQVRHVLGAQANVWTEHMPDMQHVEYAVFPRLDALAEVLWTPPGRRDWRDFLGRLPAQLARYRRARIAYADSAFAPVITLDEAAARASGRSTLTLSTQAGLGTLRYSLDGSAPNPGSPVYSGPVPVTLPVTVRATTFAPDGRILAMRTRSFDAASLLRRDGNTLVNCPGSPFRLRVQPLPDATSWRPVYTVNLFNACQLWPVAPLDGTTALHVDLARLPNNYQLAHEAGLVVQRKAATAHGELVIRRDGCDGPVLASVPLPDPDRTPRRFALQARFPRQQGTHDLCLAFTAPTDGPLYAFGRLTLQLSP